MKNIYGVILSFGAAALILAQSTAVSASETVTYTYDAKGRLIKVERSGTVNDGKKTEYEYDKADNRKQVKATDAQTPS
jgi:YD repeat-containing protein